MSHGSLDEADIIISQIVAYILCSILVFVVFFHTAYNLCLRKMFRICCFGSNSASRDEANLMKFFEEFGSKIKSTIFNYNPADEISLFFRIFTNISMFFCVLSCIASLITTTHLIMRGRLSSNLFPVRFICGISWLLGGYFQLYVFIGRLYVSFKDSVFQYSTTKYIALSLTLISLPILLLLSGLFYVIHNLIISYIFLILFILIWFLFDIVLTVLFIDRLYKLIKTRIEKQPTQITGLQSSIKMGSPSFSESNKSNYTYKNKKINMMNNKDQILYEVEEDQEEDNISNNNIKLPPAKASGMTIAISDITPYLGPIQPLTPQTLTKSSGTPGSCKISIPSTINSLDEHNLPVLSLNTSNKSNDSRTGTFDALNDNDIDPVLKLEDAFTDSLNADNDKMPIKSTKFSPIPSNSIDCNNEENDILPPMSNSTTNNDLIKTKTRSPSQSKENTFRRKTSTSSVITSAVSPRQTENFKNASKILDKAQLKLITSMTKHGLLLLMSSIASLLCVIYIISNAKYFEIEQIEQNYHLKRVNFYLYFNMLVSSFFNGLSLYLSFVFAQWMYKICCYPIHRWLEAQCMIFIVKTNQDK